jgi:hypothetical protein
MRRFEELPLPRGNGTRIGMRRSSTGTAHTGCRHASHVEAASRMRATKPPAASSVVWPAKPPWLLLMTGSAEATTRTKKPSMARNSHSRSRRTPQKRSRKVASRPSRPILARSSEPGIGA